MSDSTKEQIEFLVKLQTIETETNTIKSLIDRLPEKIEAWDTELNAFEKGIEEAQALSEEQSKDYREQEREVQENLARIQKSQAKLHAVKTNKEYQALLKEVDDIGLMNSNIEDGMLAYLETADAAEQSIAMKTEQLETLTFEIENEKESLLQETDEQKSKLAELEASREALSRSILPEWLERFNFLRGKDPKGVAIVPVVDAVCSGCNVNLPPQMHNELQRFDSMRLCPNCQRIVYWQE
ncbi:MAG: C4-type zinc ribbon domain-containing protein [Desulfobacterales bacterium]